MSSSLTLGWVLLAWSAVESDPSHVLYLHTGGLTVTVAPARGVECSGADPFCGASDAAQSTSWLPEVDADEVEVSALRTQDFGESPEEVVADLRDLVAEFFAGIDLEVVTERPPPEVEYSMVIVGGDPLDIGLGAAVAGLSPLDCANSNRRDVSFTFSERLETLKEVALVCAHEAAHSYGLEHVFVDEFVMNPNPRVADAGFSRACTPIVPAVDLSNPDGIKCLHMCESMSHQSTYAELLDLFGASEEGENDEASPELGFANPAPGTHFVAPDASFRIDLVATDDVGLVEAQLGVNGGEPVIDLTYPFAFEARGWPAGAFRLDARVRDASGKTADATLSVYVGAAPSGSAALDWPMLPPGALKPYAEDQSGDPVPCTSDAQCYGGTRCIDGICLRAEPLGCALTPRPTAVWAWYLLAGLFWSRRSRPVGERRRS